MGDSGGWSIDVKSCTEQGLVDLLQQLEGSENLSAEQEIRTELVNRAKNAGLTTSQIVNSLILQTSPGMERNRIGKTWAAALQITEEGFKKLASGV